MNEALSVCPNRTEEEEEEESYQVQRRTHRIFPDFRAVAQKSHRGTVFPLKAAAAICSLVTFVFLRASSFMHVTRLGNNISYLDSKCVLSVSSLIQTPRLGWTPGCLHRRETTNLRSEKTFAAARQGHGQTHRVTFKVHQWNFNAIPANDGELKTHCLTLK